MRKLRLPRRRDQAAFDAVGKLELFADRSRTRLASNFDDRGN